MYGTGLLKGLGITLKHAMDTFRDDGESVPSRYLDSRKLNGNRRILEQNIEQEGLLTIQYPEEKRLLPERFRYIPMLIWDTEENVDLCTACGICAKVCPPQCIWIVRDSDENGRPVARPAEFYIDAAVCMSCSFCTEFCPFDAIKMNHDYELAVYDRYPHLVYNKAELTVPQEYYAALWPAQFEAEEQVRQQKAEAEKRKAEEKARKEAEKQASGGEKKKRTPEELKALKEQAAAKAKARKADEDPEAKKARIEELKRKAQEKAKARKNEAG
ncbi:MAG: 4Fe-4S binding protein [Chloroflexota bacterium]